jgi:hypothetical protein
MQIEGPGGQDNGNAAVPESGDRPETKMRRQTAKTKLIVSLGLVAIIVISIWMSFASSPIAGIACFFGLTGLLWSMAKIKRWI